MKFTNLLFVVVIVLMTGLQPASASPTSPVENPADWPQIGHDPQRTNYSSVEVDPPYCYAWKWYEAPLASRAQPVVSAGRLYIGSMDGTLFARNATTGAPLWRFETGSPIRDSAAVYNSSLVIFSTYSGITYALNAANGQMTWQQNTGSSATAPLIDPTTGVVIVASTNGDVTALNASTGVLLWQHNVGAPILTTPALSADEQTVYVGSEAIQAIALNASSGAELWHTQLQGQSLGDRYPVVANGSIIYRSQPIYFFHNLLHEGDTTMDQAGAWSTSFNSSVWGSDWNNVKPYILNYLNTTPSKQTYFVLDPATGVSRGTAPVLYTYGDNDIPNMPVVRGSETFLTYRARHGMQTDSNTIHVTSKYDAELGKMTLPSLDITPLTSTTKISGVPEFRMTSDEPSMLSMGGNILWVDNFERLGGLNVNTGVLVHAGAVSNTWPDCTNCTPGSPRHFLPLVAGNPDLPFPSPAVTDGNSRSGAVIANNMVYWMVLQGGLAAFSHMTGASCPSAPVYGPVSPPTPPVVKLGTPRPLEDYLTLDLTQANPNPSIDLQTRIRSEITTLISYPHLMPYFLQRGFSSPRVWPYNTDKTERPAQIIGDGVNGTAFWHDPGDLIIASAMAYPYLDANLQNQLKTYLASEWSRFPPLQSLPFNAPGNQDWLRQGASRELYSVPFRSTISDWPPPAASLNALYGLWLWSKNSGDWTYGQAHWNEAKNLFNARTPVNHSQGKMDYLSDLAGVIGFFRLAVHYNDTASAATARTVALGFMQDAINNLSAYFTRADGEYKDPRDVNSGWYAPALFGLTPEVGLFLREQSNGAVQQYLFSKEYGTNGDGLRWWYITRVGAHAEVGETSFEDPFAGWSHFLAHAYLVGNTQEELRNWLDRPWGKGDLYFIEKLVATLQAQPAVTDLSSSRMLISNPTPRTGSQIQFTLQIRNSGAPLAGNLYVTETLPAGLSFANGSIAVIPVGGVSNVNGNLLTWQGSMPQNGSLDISFQALVTLPAGTLETLTNNVTLKASGIADTQLSGKLIVNGLTTYVPAVTK